MSKLFVIATLAMIACTVSAQDRRIEGLPIKLGDSIDEVKAALGTTLEPEDSKSAAQPKTKALRLRTKGIWVFFDQTGRTYTIRLDAPFAGNVAGVQIGEPRAALVAKLGKPAKIIKKQPQFSKRLEVYLYYIDNLTSVRFHFDRDDEIETIFVSK
jgi:hypothetical protein